MTKISKFGEKCLIIVMFYFKRYKKNPKQIKKIVWIKVFVYQVLVI